MALLFLASLGATWAAQARRNRQAILARLRDRVGGRLERLGPLTDQVVGEHGGRTFRMQLGTRAAVWGGSATPCTSGWSCGTRRRCA